MEWVIAVIVIVALGVAALAAAGGMGEMSKDPDRDVYRQDLPDTPLVGEDIRRLRFGVSLRGYAMGQVDDILDRLSREIAERDATIEDLRRGYGLGPEPGLETPELPRRSADVNLSGAPDLPAESDLPAEPEADSRP